MESRMDRYKNKGHSQSRVEKNQDLYKMIYSAYDEYENYKVPLEEREIDLSSIKKISRSEYKSDYVRAMEEKKEKEISNAENNSSKDVYDIKELLDKVKTDNMDERRTDIRKERYLDKLHLKNDVKTNLDTIKEKYEEIILDSEEEDKLSNTANLSLEILSDLKSNDTTLVSPPMKEDIIEEDNTYTKIKKEEVKEEKEDDSFYSDMYKFKKKDFETDDDEDDDEDDDDEEDGNGFLFKILIIISIIILMALILIYLVGYFSK